MLVALLGLVLLLLLSPLPASAHTQLDDTRPGDGQTLEDPPGTVELDFSLPVTPLADGLEITGPEGAVPLELETTDEGTTWVADLGAPLPPGAYTASWTMAAQDGHPLDGEFGFVVAETMDDQGTADNAALTSAPPASSPTPAPEEEADATTGASDAVTTALARIGSALALWGTLVAAGALVFAVAALRGPDAQDRPVPLRLARMAAGVLLVGLVVRVVGRTALVTGGSLWSALDMGQIGSAVVGSTRWVLGLQAAGALLVLLAARPRASAAALAPAWLGAAALGVGHLLGGHSATAEPRWLVVSADIAHLAAGAIWMGGVLALALLVRHRRRTDSDLPIGMPLARFSTWAAGSLAVVGVSGLLLALTIVERLDQFWTTTWGVLLLVKLALVAVIAVLGAVNHLRVVPALASRHHSGLTPRAAADGLRLTTLTEALLMTAVAVITAFLVGATMMA